jgi:GNAT superfamily N-acetyltransferase
MSTNPEVSFKRLTIENWPEFAYWVLKSEHQYPDEIKSSEENYLFALSKKEAPSILLFCEGQYAGNAVCCPFTKEEIDALELDDTFPVADACYLYNIVIDPQFQGKGLGKILFEKIAQEAKDCGYRKLAGHFRPNGSLSLAQKAGAKEIKPHPDWGDTGETYVYCELEL